MSEAAGDAFASIGVRVDSPGYPIFAEFLPVVAGGSVDVALPVVDVALEGDSLELNGQGGVLDNHDRAGHPHLFVVALAFLKHVLNALRDKLEPAHIDEDAEPGRRGLQKDLGIIEPLLHFFHGDIAGKTQLKPIPFFLNRIRKRISNSETDHHYRIIGRFAATL